MVRRLVPLALLALLAACAPVSDDSSSGASPTGPPTGDAGIPTIDSPEIPAAAMLTDEDVGAGYTFEEWTQGDDHGSLSMLLTYCGEAGYSEARDHLLTTRRGSVHRDEESYVLVTLTRYQAGWAQRHVSDLQTVLPRCAEIPIMGSDVTAALTVVEADGAGDGSLLIREDRDTGAQFHAVVRQGDIEAQLRIHTGGDEAQARAMVAAAANRLCAATETC